MGEFTHIDREGNAVMVDVSEKKDTERMAVAEGYIRVSREVYEAADGHTVKKGDVLAAARIAGIMAAKKTSDLIPLCHPLLLTKVSVDFSMREGETGEEDLRIYCRCSVKLTGKTGVEMEALTGVSVALLTIYDMCKALDKTMEICDIRLVEKSGGKSGHFIHPNR